MKNIKTYFLFFILISCQIETYHEDTVLINSVLCLKEGNSPFSGVVIHTFDDGKISGRFTYSNGKLHGKWITFDHQGDKVQEGEYLVDKRIEDYTSKLDFVKSTSLCLTQEGDYNFLELNIDLINVNEKSFDTLSNYINNHFLKIYLCDDYFIRFYHNSNLVHYVNFNR